MDSTWTDAHLEALGPMRLTHKLEPMIAIFGPGGRSGKRPHTQPREEFALVLSGQVTLTLADEENTLKAGDTVTFPPRAPRLWENRTEEIVEILMVSPRGVA